MPFSEPGVHAATFEAIAKSLKANQHHSRANVHLQMDGLHVREKTISYFFFLSLFFQFFSLACCFCCCCCCCFCYCCCCCFLLLVFYFYFFSSFLFFKFFFPNHSPVLQIQSGVLMDNCGKIVGLPDAELAVLLEPTSFSSACDAAMSTLPKMPASSPPTPGAAACAVAFGPLSEQQMLEDEAIAAQAATTLSVADRIYCFVLVCAERDKSIVGRDTALS